MEEDASTPTIWEQPMQAWPAHGVAAPRYLALEYKPSPSMLNVPLLPPLNLDLSSPVSLASPPAPAQVLQLQPQQLQLQQLQPLQQTAMLEI